MAILIFGLILSAIPFLLMDFFSDKKKGFIYVLFFLLLFQSVLGILTQALGIFYYGVILSATLLADIIVLFFFIRRGNIFSKRGNYLRKIDWVVLFVVLVSALSLYQVHYNYTGKINLAADQTVVYHQAKNMVYPYPYFSDEWYAVSLVNGAISNHSLPVKNILNNTFFLNLELFFHSFIAEITLLLGLNILLQYTILSILLNTIIVLLVYLFLRVSGVSKLSAGICSLLALYIASGANLPGLWQLIPFNSGIIFFLLSMCFMEFASPRLVRLGRRDWTLVILSTIVSSLFYPPLIPFYFVGLLVFLFTKIKTKKERFYEVITYSFLSLFFVIPIAYVLLMISPLAGITGYILSRIFFVSFVAPYLPKIDFYNIIPIPAILLAIFGVYFICKKKKWILLSELILGAVLWIFCSLGVNRFFAEYERIAIITSIIIVIVAGFGLRQIEDYVRSKFKENGDKILKVLETALLCIFLLLIPFYTQQENWKNVMSIDSSSGDALYPKSPANNYLVADDLRIFKNIKNKTFLSIPWKGTVIGVATGNYPVLTKQGTISMGSSTILNSFQRSDCQGKEDIAKELNLDYIYIYQFDCPNFEVIDESSENFVLYKLKND